MSENPWRYFTTVDPGCIVRTRPGSPSRYYIDYNDGYEDCDLAFEWWDKAAMSSRESFREITEEEASAIVGGRPWDEVKS